MSDAATGRVAAHLPDALRSRLTVRRVTDADAAGLVALIGAAYDEYACGPLDPEGFDADLRAPASTARQASREWWVATVEGTVVASVAHGPLHATSDPDSDSERPVVELHRLYLAPSIRGSGLASALVRAMAEEARRARATALEAWSDTRLVDAHRRYRALGMRATTGRRELHDPAGTTEQLFALDL